MTEIWLYWILSIVIGGIITGIVKSILLIKTNSKYRYGSLIYSILDTAVNMVIGYILLSAMTGHWLK